MFVLGHLGVGSRMLLGLRRRLPAWPLYLGCVLPDLIDKPLFYIGGRSALITGTRTFGHTGLFLLALLLVAGAARRPWAWAVFAGVATHFALDIAGEFFAGSDPESSIWLAIFYPAYHQFPLAQFDSITEHIAVTARSAYSVIGELAGGAILLWSWLSPRNRRA